MKRILSICLGIAISAATVLGVGVVIHNKSDSPFGAATAEEPIEAEVGELMTLTSDGASVTWLVEPAVPYVAYGPQTENIVTSFQRPGQYFIYAASINSDAGTTIRRFPVRVASGAAPAPTSDLTQYAGPKQDAVKLAAAFRAVADSVQVRLDNGILVTPEQTVNETAAANRTALGSGASAWSTYFSKLQEKLQAANLQSMPEHIAYWRALAQELEAYSK